MSEQPLASPETGNNRATLPRRRWRTLVVLLAVVITAILVAWWLNHRWHNISIDDARIAGRMITLSSEVNGRVVRLPVVAGEQVSQGQLLAAIDQEDTELELLSLDAQLTGLHAQQEELQAEQAMQRTQIASRINEGNAQIASAKAAHEASRATLKRALHSYERIKRLTAHKAMSQQELEDATAELEVARQQERLTAANIDKERAGLAVTRAEQAQITVLARRLDILAAQKTALEAQRRQKLTDLGRREIRAAFDGVIDAVFLEVGEYVAPGSRLLLYHDPARIWVDANIKETQFSRLRIGATASVKVDAYPDTEFTAHIERLGGAATSLFALLPSPNPSGNFTKITQRLPIRLSIDQQDNLLRPGMMVELSIHVD